VSRRVESSNPFQHFTQYERRHLVAHLEAAEQSDDLHRLIALGTAQQRNAWFEARDRCNEVAGYMADLDIARSLADSVAASRSRGRLESVALQCRYALIASVIRSLAQSHKPELIARYMQAGMWTQDQALAWAQLSDPQAGLQAMVDALRRDQGEDRDELGRLALATGANIGDPDNRVLAVAEMAENLPADLLGGALDIVARESNEGSRFGGLEQIVRKLPKDLRLKALEMAQQFEQLDLKARAIAVVALTLDEPERTEAFRASLDVVRSAIAAGRQREADNPFLSDPAGLEQLAHIFPPEWLDELLALSRREGSSRQLQSVLWVLLKRYADRNPDWVWNQLPPDPAWQRDDVLERVALAYLKKGLWKEAAEAVAEISTSVGGLKIRALVEILKQAPESEWPRFTALFGELSDYYRITALRELAASPEVSALLLQQLAETLTAEQERLEARAAIARTLTATELEEIIDAYLARSVAASSRPRGMVAQMVVAVAPYLSAAQVRHTLDAIGEPESLEPDVHKALLVRLADLGEPSEALHRFIQLRFDLEYRRANVLVELATHLPDQYLPSVLAATRPASVAVERVQARVALMRWLPPDAVDDIVSEACGLTHPLDRVRVISEMVRELPAEHLEGVGRVLTASLRDTLRSPSLDRERILRQGFRALSRVLDRAPSTEATDQAMALARDESLSAAGQVELLVDLASAGGVASHVRLALGAAARIAGSDVQLTSILASGVSAAHTPVLNELLAEQNEPWQLVAFLSAVSHLLDDAVKDEAYRRVAAIDDTKARLSGLGELLPHLETSRRWEAVSVELTRESEWSWEWSWEPETYIFATSVLAPAAPEAMRPHLESVDAAFDWLGPWEKVEFAVLLNEADFAHEVIDEALAAVEELPKYRRPAAIALLAPWLDGSQIVRALSWLADHQDLDIEPALVALTTRASALRDADLVSECLNAPKSGFMLRKLIEDSAPELPLEALSPAGALVEDHSGTALGALAVRAAELGDMNLALRFLDRKGEAGSIEDRTLQRVYQFAPSSWAEVLITRAEKIRPEERATALLELIDRTPRKQRRYLVESIVESAASLQLALDGERLRVMHVLGPELRRLPISAIVAKWTQAMQHSSMYSRNEIFVDVRAFSPTLVSHFGSAIALRLDEAILLGGGEVWP
jgi:hypothetical protein